MQSIQTNGTLGGAHVQGVHKPEGRNKKVWVEFFLTLLVLCIMILPADGRFVTQSDRPHSSKVMLHETIRNDDF